MPLTLATAQWPRSKDLRLHSHYMSVFLYLSLSLCWCLCKAGHTLCDFRAISAMYQLTLYEKIACDVKPKAHDLCAHTIAERNLCTHTLRLIVEHDLYAHPIRVKYSGCACADNDTVYGR